MKWDVDGLEMFHCGSMLRARLPALGWHWDLVADGIMVRKIDEHTLTPHDVIRLSFSEMATFKEFQEILDKLTVIVTDDILAGVEAKAEARRDYREERQIAAQDEVMEG